jgi:hypothetical protein
MVKIDPIHEEEVMPDVAPATGWRFLLRALFWRRQRLELTPFQRCLAVHILSARPRGGFL